jgi:hypothetical protein
MKHLLQQLFELGYRLGHCKQNPANFITDITQHESPLSNPQAFAFSAGKARRIGSTVVGANVTELAIILGLNVAYLLL